MDQHEDIRLSKALIMALDMDNKQSQQPRPGLAKISLRIQQVLHETRY